MDQTKTLPKTTALTMLASGLLLWCLPHLAGGCAGPSDESAGGGLDGAAASTGTGGDGAAGNADQDDDGDGYTLADGDCDDGDSAIHPGAIEICTDSIDNNCNGATDDAEPDGDGDGYGPCAGDCDDDDATVSPGEDEIPDNQIDDDCDGLTDPYYAASVGPEHDLGSTGTKLDAAIEPDGDLHLAYQRDYKIYYRRQVDGAWDMAERLVPGTNISDYNSRFYPHLAVDSAGTAHVAWSDVAMSHVYHNSFAGQWSGRQAVITDTFGGPDTNRCDVTVDQNDQVIVASQSDNAIEYNIKPADASFQSEDVLFLYNMSDPEPQSPTLAASRYDDAVVGVWAWNWGADGLQTSAYAAGTWTEAQAPAGGGGCCASYNEVALDPDGRTHVAWIRWTDGGNFSHLEYTRQKSDGQWTAKQTFVQGPDFFHCPQDECPHPQVAVSASGAVLLAYADGHDGSSRLRYHLKLPGKNNPWAPAATITDASTYQNFPALVVEGDTFHLFWTDGRGGGAIYHRSIQVELTEAD